MRGWQLNGGGGETVKKLLFYIDVCPTLLTTYTYLPVDTASQHHFIIYELGATQSSKWPMDNVLWTLIS